MCRASSNARAQPVLEQDLRRTAGPAFRLASVAREHRTMAELLLQDLAALSRRPTFREVMELTPTEDNELQLRELVRRRESTHPDGGAGERRSVSSEGCG
jgi:hypothetical protein